MLHNPIASVLAPLLRNLRHSNYTIGRTGTRVFVSLDMLRMRDRAVENLSRHDPRDALNELDPLLTRLNNRADCLFDLLAKRLSWRG